MAPQQEHDRPRLSRARLLVPALVWLALVGLLVHVWITPGSYGDQAAPYRLVAYPLLALVLPAAWLLSRTPRPLPATAATLVTLPFVVDTIGNIGDLYGRISWWDDLNHYSNWLLLCGGIGLALLPFVRPAWALVLLVVGLGALLAIGWELGEYRFFYSAPYSGRLYRDTLGDETLGVLGALTAGLLVGIAAALTRRRRR
jgi:hypothetical protein